MYEQTVMKRRANLSGDPARASRGQVADLRHRREKLAMVGACLSGAYPPDDQGLNDLLAELSAVDSEGRAGRR